MLNRSDKIIAIKPLTDSGNSFVRLFSDAVARQGYRIRDFDWQDIENIGADAAILHWPYELLGLGGLRGMGRYLDFRSKLARARAQGTRIIWVAHNARPHDGGWVSRMLMRQFVGMIDGIIHLSHHSRVLVDQLYSPASRIVQIETVHGDYRDVMVLPLQPAPSMEQHVKIAYFGQIRRYKNVELLARLVAAAPSQIALCISGRRSHEDVAAEIERIAEQAPNISLDIRDESLPDADIERVVDAAHGVVLPYQAILNSGAAIFALSRGRPVLAPRTGSLPELQEIVGADWLQLYEGALDARALNDFARWLSSRPPLAMPDLTALSWDRVSDDIGRLLDAVTAS